MRVLTRVRAEIAASPERVFDLVVDERYCSHFFRSWGPIPGVVHCEPWIAHGEAGRRRELKLSDGSTHAEQILVLERPHKYEYRWLNPPAAPLNLFVRTAEAHWALQPMEASAHTRLVLTYHFELTSPLAYPVALVLRAMFTRWMEAAIERVKQTIRDGAPLPAR
jgi:uncharacterized protein YndB with AHSA1/START domain